MGAWLHSIWGNLDWTLIGRLVLTLILCGVIGLERSRHERASGFRPHILVGLGACLMTLAGAYGFSDLRGVIHAPLDLAGYVISGIGFLGAGAILRHGATVRGITTAATLWAAAGLGITVAVGLGGLAVVGTLLMLFTLTPLSRLEARLRWGERKGSLAIHLTNDQRAVGKALTALHRLGVPLRSATILPGVGTRAILRVELDKALSAAEMPLLEKRLLTLKYVERIETHTPVLDRDLPLDDQDVADGDAEAAPAILHLEDETLLHDLQEENSATDSE